MYRHLLFLLILAPLFTFGQLPDAYTHFEIGSRQVLLADKVNVRVAPQSNAAVQEVLPIGTELTILEAADSLTLNGIAAAWYKVKYAGKAGESNGYVWGGLIASYSAESLVDPSVQFLFGLVKFTRNEDEMGETKVQVRAVRDHKELAKLEFEAIGETTTSNHLFVKSPGGITGIQDVLEFNFSDGFCAGAFGEVYIVWTGKDFVNMITVHDGIDAPYVYEEQIIFPSEEGGKSGKILFVASSNEKYADDENADVNQMDVVERKTYVWDGKQLNQTK